MNAKKFWPVAAIALAVPALSHADNSVQLYGILDAGIAQVSHSLGFDPNHPVEIIPYANAAGSQSATGMYNGGLSASRWGIKGSEDMGDGLKAQFALESAFNVSDGVVSNAAASMASNTSKGPNMSADSAVSGQFFARQSWVGLGSDRTGQLSIGRHQSFFVENIAQFDPMQGSQIFSPIGFSGTYGGGGNTEDSRIDNSVRYSGKFSDIRVGAQYKFGGLAGNRNAQTSYQLNLVYDTPTLALNAGYQHFNDAFAASNGATLGTLAVTANNTTAYMLAARYRMDKLVLRAGYEREQLTNPSNPSADAITTLFNYPISGSVNVNPYAHEKDLNVYWAGAGYDVNAALSLTAAYYQVNQNDYSGTGCATASGKCAGTSRFYSLLADYHFSKRTDVYAGLMKNNVSGGLGYGYAYSGNLIVGTGLRHMF